MRILVTGSRGWADERFVRYQLFCRLVGWDEPLTIVEGACEGSPDETAYAWAMEQGKAGRKVTAERHPADWKSLGKRAGFARNAEMVGLGADLCLAFIRNYSPGATNCANLAAAHGIPTRIFREDADGNYLGEDQ